MKDMALIKTVCFFAFVEVVLSMEHHLFGIPLPHINDPVIHNVGNLLIHGVEDITGIHSKGNDMPMDMGGMDMSAGGSMAGMKMGGGGEESPLGDIGTLLGLGGGVTAPTPVAKASVSGGMDMSAGGKMAGMKMGGGGEESPLGDIGTLLGLGGGVTAPPPGAKVSVSRTSISGKNQIDQKQLLQYIQYLKAQKAKEGSSSASVSVSGSSPSSDAILKYLVENTKPAQTQKTFVIKTQGADSAEVQKKLAALLAAQSKQ